MEIKELIEFLTGPYAYYLFFIVMILCGLGWPLNGDLIMLTMGVLSGVSELSPFYLYILSILGLNLGDTVTFLVGKKFGYNLLRLWPFYHFINKNKVKKIRKSLIKSGKKLIFFVRFVPGTRTATIATAGIFKMKYLPFLASNLIAVSTLSALLIFGGNLIFSDLDQAQKNFKFVILGFFSFSIILYIASRKLGQIKYFNLS